MILAGRAWRVGDDVGAAAIIQPQYIGESDPALLAAHCLAEVAPDLAEQAREGDLLLAGQHFGAGADPSLAEVAVLALQALGIAAVIAASAGAEFVAAATLYGLPVIASAEAAYGLPSDKVLRLDLERGSVEAHGGTPRFAVPPCPPTVVAAVRRAQLLAYTRRVAEGEGFTE